MIRSSRSISDNIAEGYGRFQFCRHSRGSAYELINHLITADDCSFITDAEFRINKNQIIRCIKLINGYIGYLKKAKSNHAIREKDVSYQNLDVEPNNE